MVRFDKEGVKVLDEILDEAGDLSKKEEGSSGLRGSGSDEGVDIKLAGADGGLIAVN